MTRAPLIAVLCWALLASGCAGRDLVAELDACTAREVLAPDDGAFSAVVHAALDAGFTPVHVDRQKGEFAGWMEGHFDGGRDAAAAAVNAGIVALELGAYAAAMFSGDYASTPMHGPWASGRVRVLLLVRLTREQGSVAVRALVAAPGSEQLEPGFTDAFWGAMRSRIGVREAQARDRGFVPGAPLSGP